MQEPRSETFRTLGSFLLRKNPEGNRMNHFQKWLKAAGIRAVRTFAEAALAYIGTSATVLGDVNWIGVLSAGAFGAVTAMLLALKGLPEVEE